jgi:hypothetical protein
MERKNGKNLGKKRKRSERDEFARGEKIRENEGEKMRKKRDHKRKGRVRLRARPLGSATVAGVWIGPSLVLSAVFTKQIKIL